MYNSRFKKGEAMSEQFTISVFTENHVGILNRITVIFTRRHINIESLTVSETEVHGISRYTIVVTETRDRVKKVVKQIERQIEVFEAYYHTSDEVIYQEIALYKLPIKAITENGKIESIIRKHHARILTVEENGEAFFLPVIGQDHVANMPYEIILQDTEATMLAGKYRIALFWPELTMSTFMKIMSTPGDIEDTMEGLCETEE